jgi:hypothetical protein
MLKTLSCDNAEANGNDIQLTNSKQFTHKCSTKRRYVSNHVVERAQKINFSNLSLNYSPKALTSFIRSAFTQTEQFLTLSLQKLSKDYSENQSRKSSCSCYNVRHSLFLYAAISVFIALCYLTQPSIASETKHLM